MFFKRENGVKIYYEFAGNKEGTAIIMIHGLGFDHNMFKPQLKKYSQEGFFVVVPDMRGHGKSSKVNKLNLLDWVEDIFELIEHLNLEKVIILGVSMGGVIAQKFTVKHPEKIEKMILSDTFGEISSFAEKAAAYSQVYGFKLFKYLPEKFVAGLIASPYKDYSDEIYNYFKEVSANIDLEQVVLARKAINKIDVLEELKKISIPALVLVGDKAQVLVKSSKKIVDSLKNADLKVIGEALDPSNLTNTEDFDQYVIEFAK